MDVEREEKREIKRETNHRRSQPVHIPIDLTLEILSRLPLKSIVRFGCVSKLWSSFITLPCFIGLFTSLSSSRPPSLLLCVAQQGRLFTFLFSQNQNPQGSTYSPVYSFHFTNPYGFSCPCSDSVHGLILLPRLIIWNPSLRRALALPLPNEHNSSRFWSYLVYDPLECKHKVLYINEDFRQPQVLTLGAQESWRVIKKSIPMHRSDYRGKCINGVLYYKTHIDDQPIIMSFDVKSENFNPIKYPKCVPEELYQLIPCEGRLALVHINMFSPDISVYLYILKDEDGQKWTHQSVFHVPCKSERRNRLSFEGVTDAGELVFASYCFPEPIYVLYFDPKRNITREAFLRGIDGEIRRCGLDSKYMSRIDAFPNHIESLFLSL